MRIIAVALLLLFVNGCVSIEDKSYYTKDDIATEVDPYIIELNDEGELHHKEQAKQYLDKLDTLEDNTHVIIFVHGWRHNASPEDRNLKEFKTFMTHLENNSNDDFIGLYVGWRGDSRKGFDLHTLEDRKKVSKVVGAKGLRTIIQNTKDKVPKNSNVKLAVIGHSLGGSAVFNAISKDLKDGSFQNSSHQSYIMLNPAFSKQEFTESYAGIADRELEESEQPLVIFQAQEDWAVKWLLPIFTDTDSVGFSPDDTLTHTSWACSQSDKDCLDMLQKKKKIRPECNKVLNNDSWFIKAFNDKDYESCMNSWKAPAYVIQTANTISGSHNEILTSTEAKALLDFFILK
ncbi:alpha/beta hydrolase [Vibrio splendidus]|uniref:alpha/beta hydrolase n=1 Tax=Vibrio splendidus TaxID=29497 RepID=UPI000C858232|nr:alpha/beta hydrolase [Vibrio splendidus]PMJ85308.1 hypothetical protein BCU23_08625 [Vibrio splendidus]